MASRLNNDDIIKRIKDVHGDLYDLLLVNYKNRRTKIELACKKHGSWMAFTEQLFRGQGCPVCGKKQAGKTQRIKFDDFVKRANKIHTNKYYYFDDDYVKITSKLKIECPLHGVFFQRGDSHIRQKQGCPICGLISQGNKRRMTLKEFVVMASKVHSNKYDYAKVNYKNNRTKVTIICPKHGSFSQEPDNHFNGVGCPNCNTSRGEDKIKSILIDNQINFTQQHTFDGLKYIGKLKCDFYLTEYNAVIEFNGRQHYEPVRAFGGKKALIETQKRDELKRCYLNDNKIKILEIHYKEKNIEKLILDFIN